MREFVNSCGKVKFAKWRIVTIYSDSLESSKWEKNIDIEILIRIKKGLKLSCFAQATVCNHWIHL